MSQAYLVDFVLYPEFLDLQGANESVASSAAQDSIDSRVSPSLQRRWRGLVVQRTLTTGTADLAARLNSAMNADLRPIVQASLPPGASVNSVSVVQPSEWTPTGGGYHESRLPVIVDMTAGGGTATAEWELATGPVPIPGGSAPLQFVVFGHVRWKIVDLL